MNPAEGLNLSHRKYSIIDRSVLSSNPGPQPAFNPRNPPVPGLVPHFSIID
jgi:hypothetical protein